MIRLAVHIDGIVQGVGFRPFVHGAATRRGLSGWVRNGTEGVRLEVQGAAGAVHDLVDALRRDAPPPARVERLEAVEIAPRGETGFHIVESRGDRGVRATLPADLATCPDCLAEIATPGARRHRYAFTNCTRCGPRYTILERLPYDRASTSMAGFALCPACRTEHDDPTDRRFHAQPIACPRCGPSLRAVSPDGLVLATGDAALGRCVVALGDGAVVALQGLGGFQLLCDATSEPAVARLRARKRREDKPFAVMFPTLEALREACVVSGAEEALLRAPAAPIVLVRRRTSAAVPAPSVAPRSPLVGAMLPSTPLHALLLGDLARPLVCTSGNLSEEPMCTREDDARADLAGVADLYLAHDRPIVRPMDDSVVRLGPSGPLVLRRARGYAPLPHPFPEAPCILALGGQLKSTITLATGGQAVVSQHLGDLFGPEAVLLHERTVDDLLAFLDGRPAVVACDLHPDYASTRLAEQLAARWSVPLERVQHHHAHVAAVVAEHGVEGPVLGLAWDGAGLGDDGLLWGGEALALEGASARRVAHLRPFALPGGERAIREPRRSALGLVHAVLGRAGAARELAPAFGATELRVLLDLLERGVSCPRTTSAGRLFDAVAALSGVRDVATYEGQAAIELEHAADDAGDTASGRAGPSDAYPLPLGDGSPAVADWEPLVLAVLDDRARGAPAAVISARLHAALAGLAEAIAARAGLERVALAGGCFQNARLLGAVHARLRARGHRVLVPARYPPGDGGLSLGQAYVAALRRRRGDVPGHPR